MRSRFATWYATPCGAKATRFWTRPVAAEARRIAAAHKGRIHLLIADVVMPKEGGRELAASLVSRRPAMKVLFMSGYTDQAVESEFIQKPFTPAALSRKVREILEQNGETRRSASH